MTIRKRLLWSNILMIIVPVLSAALAGLLCLGFIWICILNGAGLDTRDPEDFYRVCLAVTETLEHQLDRGQSPETIAPLLDSNGITLQLLRGEETVYSFGESDSSDELLLHAASELGSNAMVSQDGRSLFIARETIHGSEYTVYLLGGGYDRHSYEGLKVAIAISALLLAFTVFLSVLLTNRFLTRFVFRRIEEPLDILTKGVREIRDGNLGTHIDYAQHDEFRPVCEDFNDMALRLKESVARQQQDEQSRKELLAGISHDIRSPLTSIQAYAEGLLDGTATTPEAQQRYLSTIKNKARELDHMVSQLFLFSKMELGDYPENPRFLRLDEKLRCMVLDAQGEFAENGMMLETELTPAVVHIDPTQLERVIANIMDNSLKYKTETSGLLRIRLENKGEHCVLTFDDDGPGTTEDALPRLFEVFYRSDPARSNTQKGSGLGLAIAKNIISHAGGTITAKKSELGGLRIEIELPCTGEEENHGENTDCGR